jgi:hypothetical protein
MCRIKPRLDQAPERPSSVTGAGCAPKCPGPYRAGDSNAGFGVAAQGLTEPEAFLVGQAAGASAHSVAHFSSWPKVLWQTDLPWPAKNQEKAAILNKATSFWPAFRKKPPLGVGIVFAPAPWKACENQGKQHRAKDKRLSASAPGRKSRKTQHFP